MFVLSCFSKCEKVPIFNRGSRTPREISQKYFSIYGRPAKPQRCFFLLCTFENECITDPRTPRDMFLWKNECVTDPRTPRYSFLLCTLKNECVTDPRTPRKMFLWKNDCVTDPRNSREPPAKFFFALDFEKWICHRPGGFAGLWHNHFLKETFRGGFAGLWHINFSKCEVKKNSRGFRGSTINWKIFL